VATRWETIGRPAGFSEAIGFSHVAIYEFEDIDAGAPRLLELLDSGRENVHVAHTVIGVEVMKPVGAWNQRAEPHAGLNGQVIAFTGPNDPAKEDEWHAWYDQTHVPDMMASGAFVDTTRWVRTEPARFGLNYLTVYDVELEDVGQAVALSGAAMIPVIEQGRLMECHAGGLRMALRPAGRYRGSGYRADG
jgi:hypothetical protein